jgi:hypothetical protein
MTYTTVPGEGPAVQVRALRSVALRSPAELRSAG